MTYLDSAATSMIKPDSVQYAMLDAMLNCASPGRGGHAQAMRAADVCYTCRENAAKLFGAAKPENIVFTFNATHALNIAIRSLVCEGTRVAVSGYEHNSVMRPLRAAGAKITEISTPLFDADAFLRECERVIPQVDVVVCTHVSNVFGYVLPIAEVARLCRRYLKHLIIDASQSAGLEPINAQKLSADFIAAPGHKALLGPQGTGLLICKNEAKPLLYGGSGSDSRFPLMPDYLPDKLEAGTHNVPGIAGLNAGIKYILSHRAEYNAAREQHLLKLFCDGIEGARLQLFRSADDKMQSGVLSVVPYDMPCEIFADALSSADVSVRAGLHCSPLAHETAGTLQTGTVRFSFSPLLGDDEVLKAAETVKKLSFDSRI